MKKRDEVESLDLFSVSGRGNGNTRHTRETEKNSAASRKKSKAAPSRILTGLDIGTSKIGAIIAEVEDNGEVKIIGVGVSPSDGLRRGVVVNLEKTVQSIKRAISEAQLMAGTEVGPVYVGIAGDHIHSFNSRGVVAVSGPSHEIGPDDVRRVIDAAKAVSLPIDREIIHVLPQEFIVDDQDNIKDPIGFSGVRLEAEVHIVTGAVTSAQNIYRCVERAGLQVKNIVLEPLASSYAVLGEDEKEIGVGLIDLGGGTTDIALFFEGSIRHTAVIGLGGRNVTNDIAQGLRTPVDKAEKIKRKFGAAMPIANDQNTLIEVPGVGGREASNVPKYYLTQIIQPRVEEILTLAKREIQRSEYRDFLNAGIVLTGGGSMLDGIAELAQQIFDMPVKLGVPQGFGGLVGLARTPVHATGVGLIYYGMRHHSEEFLIPEEETAAEGDNHLFNRIFHTMKRWVTEYF